MGDLMIETMNKTCTGCCACEKICPKSCIKIVQDNEGFLIPKVDKNICINCGLCERRCPVNLDFTFNFSPCVYAVRYSVGDEILMKSASGGAFAALAVSVLKMGGVVFGAAYDENLVVKHIGINNINELYKLQSSKYVQSSTENTFIEVLSLLKEDKRVLYSGTPCQIAGLKSFLNKDYENLITVDLLCHGVPSPELFRKYLAWLNKKQGKLLEYDFRSKAKGWGSYTIKVKTQRKTKFFKCNLDPYYINFIKESTYRESCYSCKYANEHRIGDFTIGDYWGIQKFHPDFFDERGVSVLMVNSPKGEEFFNVVKDSIEYIKSDISNARVQQCNLNRPTKRPATRDTVYDGMYELSDEQYVKLKLMPAVTFKDRVKAIMPAKVKKIVKSIINS